MKGRLMKRYTRNRTIGNHKIKQTARHMRRRAKKLGRADAVKDAIFEGREPPFTERDIQRQQDNIEALFRAAGISLEDDDEH